MARERAGLEECIAVVTGAGRGIGRSIAQELAAAGAAVAVVARSAGELSETVSRIRRAGGRAESFPGDVANPAEVAGALREIERLLGPVDLLVNNAGILGPIAPFWETDPAEWWRVAEVDLRGPMMTTHAVLAGMVSRRRGRIVNIASGAAVAPFTYYSAYVASKTALLRFTECVAAEAKPFGVFAFAVEPGTVRTAMSERSADSPEGKKWIPSFRRIFEDGLDSPPERVARRVVEVALGRADRLSGRYLPLADDLGALDSGRARIEAENLYSLRIRRLENAPPSAALAAIRAAGERARPLRLKVERTIAAPRRRVFDLWTDPRALEKWFLPEGGAEWLRAPEIDARPGGRFRIDVTSEGREFHLFGEYREVAPPGRLVFSWSWGEDFPILDGPADTLVQIDLSERGGTTRLVLEHELPTAAACDAHERGWNRCFDGIAKLALERAAES